MTKLVVEPEVEVFEAARPGRRRHYTAEQKRSLLEEAALPGNTVSGTARKYGIAPSLLFTWKRTMDEGAIEGLRAGERVVAESEVRELKARVRELERLLGKKTMENEVLKDALELVRSKKLLLRGASSNKDGTP
jgi:transposase